MRILYIIMLNRIRDQKLLRSVKVRPRSLYTLHRLRSRGHFRFSLQKRWSLLRRLMPPESRRMASQTPTEKRKRPRSLQEKLTAKLDCEVSRSESRRLPHVAQASLNTGNGEDDLREGSTPGAKPHSPSALHLGTGDFSKGSVLPAVSQTSITGPTLVRAAEQLTDNTLAVAQGLRRAPGDPIKQSKLLAKRKKKAPHLLVRYRTMSRFNILSLARSGRHLPRGRGREVRTQRLSRVSGLGGRRRSAIGCLSTPNSEAGDSIGEVDGWQRLPGFGWLEKGLMQPSWLGTSDTPAEEAFEFSSLCKVNGQGQLGQQDVLDLPGEGDPGGEERGRERRGKEAELAIHSKCTETEHLGGAAHSGAEPPSCSGCRTNPLRDHQYCKGPSDEMRNATSDEQLLTPQAGKEGMIELIHEFLENFYQKYGSFIPLSKSDVLQHLNKKLNADLSDRKPFIYGEVARYQAGLAAAPMHFFRVAHNRHTLTLEDLSTLDNQNWVNDQVINMYGELIMEAVHHKVHFFNSFFHKQLITKGYEGVKRWTKKVDLFSKCLLLVPIHLEIHWSLIAVDMADRNIHFYDSQGITFRHVMENILKYILTEAKEKQCTAFQRGWKTIVNKRIPQQKNDNDCGVFVLEYCKRLALERPLLFSQADMPRIRKRIYKELCQCKLMD